MTHNISKRASDMLWELSKKLFHALVEDWMQSNTKKKIPTFTHLRRVLVKKYCPEVSIDLAYKNKETGELILHEDLRKIPVAEYRQSCYEPLHEIASVKVITQ